MTAPTERRGERDRRESVERRLEGELLEAQTEPVGQRPEDRQRSDAEDQRGGDEAFDEPSPRPRCPAVPESRSCNSAAQCLQPCLDSQ